MFSAFEVSLDLPEVLVSDQIKAINVGAGRIYLLGKITYTDAFDRRHKSRFCYYLKVGEWNDGKLFHPCMATVPIETTRRKIVDGFRNRPDDDVATRS